MVKLTPGSRALTLVLALMTAVGPLSTDMYLPSLPAISTALDAPTASGHLTLSVFLAGFALGQLIHGTVSDNFGRRPVLLAGLFLFVLGSAACAAAPGIEILIFARFGQAIGASAAAVLARAIVRDLYAGGNAARLLSFMGALMGLVPMVAPVFGGFLQTTFGWRASFVTSTVLALSLTAVVMIMLPETRTPSSRGQWSARQMRHDYADLLSNRIFLRYLTTICLGFAGLFTFISGSSFVLQKTYGLAEIAFGLAFAFCVTGYITGTLAGARMAGRLSLEAAHMTGIVMLGISGLMMILTSLVMPQSLAGLIVPVFFYFAGIGLVLPQGMAGALTPFPDKAGTASSLIGFVQMSSAAVFGAVIIRFIIYEPRALAWSIGAIGLASLVFALATRPVIRHNTNST